MNSKQVNTKYLNARYSNIRWRQPGFTLIEVMVALVIMAMVATLSAQAFQTATTSAAATREAMARLAEIDRTFFLIDQDLRNVIAKSIPPEFGKPLPPIYVAESDDYWLTLMRGGFANPLYQPRSEEVRVGYRFLDEEIWRDIWYNPKLTEQEDARQQKLLRGVENMNVRVLVTNATSIAAGPWLQAWPPANGANQQPIPSAIEVTLELADMGEVTRLYSLLPGSTARATTGRTPQPNPPNANR